MPPVPPRGRRGAADPSPRPSGRGRWPLPISLTASCRQIDIENRNKARDGAVERVTARAARLVDGPEPTVSS